MDRQAYKGGIETDSQGNLVRCQYIFAGINNIIDPANLDIEKGELADAVNTDFDNSNSASRRLGYSLVHAGAYHSAWSNDQKTLSYMVSNGSIYEFDGTDTYAIITLSNNNPVEFCQVNDVVAYSNGTDFGIIGGINTQYRLYSPDFKTNTIGGANLEFFNGRLYFSRGNSLYCTDVFDVEHMDVRYNRVATFPHFITMCKRVDDGLWIGTEQFLYFLKGEDPREDGFEQIQVAKYGVVRNTACKFNSEYLPESKNDYNAVIFLSTGGICSGGMGGKYLNHSFNKVSFDVGKVGTACMRYEQGMTQYIVCFNVDEGIEYNPYIIDIPIEVTTV